MQQEDGYTLLLPMMLQQENAGFTKMEANLEQNRRDCPIQ
jgi:hypothetical protein